MYKLQLSGEYHSDVNMLLEEIRQLKFDLFMMAKLADTEPQFSNPLHMFAIAQIRDEVLAHPERYDGSEE